MEDSHVSGLHGCEESLILDSRDRLSQLPDSLILEILLLLPITDVVTTTFLSRRWKDLWTTVPCLDFSNIISNIPTDNDLFKFGSNSPTNNDLFKFRRFVCGALGLWKGLKILKFSLSLWPYYNSFARDIYDIYDSWLFFSVEKQVEDLSIDFRIRSKDYYIPQFLFSCPSIKKLSLVSGKLNIDKNVQWNQLKSLTIERAELNNVSLNYILSGSPHLEVLNLSFLAVERENLIINIRSSSLKMLKIHAGISYINGSRQDALLRIGAPNLDTLDISGVGFRMCALDLDVPSLTTAILGFLDVYVRLHEILRHVLHVQKLTLSYSSIFHQINSIVYGAEPLSETVLSNFVSGAPNLEVLDLSLDNRQDMDIKSTSLKMLKISSSTYTRPDHYTISLLRIWAPNLETLEISGFLNRKLWLLDAPSLTNAILVLDHGNIALQEMLWINFQSLLNDVEKVTLSDSCTEVLLQLKMKKYREIQSNAKFLKLIYFSAPIKILGVVVMFPQLTMLVIEHNTRNKALHASKESDALVTRRRFGLLQYLKTVEITWPLHDPSIYLVIEILLKNAHMLEKMVFYPLTVSSPESMFSVEQKVRSMPRSSPTAVLIFRNK